MMNKDIFIGGHDSMRERDKGDGTFIIFLFTHLRISLENWLCQLLGRPCGALLHVII
jgi:hypothetical protein